MTAAGKRPVLLAALTVAAVLAAAVTAHASAASDLYARVTSMRDESRVLGRGSWSFTAEQSFVDRIDATVDRFHQLAAEGEPLTQTARALTDLLDETRARYTSVLEAMQAEVIRIDGDLEAVQDSQDWQQRELLAMRLLYRANWVKYETAMRFERDTAKRKRLLTDARTGFAEFLGTDDGELRAESLLGHGLTSKTLKDYDTARADFEAALELQPDPEMAVKIRIGLAETELATDLIEKALATSASLTAQAGPEDRSQALFLRAKTLLLAVGKRRYGGASPATLRREAARVLENLYNRGSYWKQKVVQLVDSGVDDPEAWSGSGDSPFVTWLIADSLRRRAECGRAVTLYEKLVDGDAFRNEALYGTGYCAFNESQYERAIERLGAYMESAGESDPNFPQAAYLRFKAAESLYLRAEAGDKEAAGARYVELLRAFLGAAPEHRYAFEAWFRLGEWHRTREEYQECADAFARVAGDSAFEIKASYLSAQCHVEAVLASGEGGETPAELVRAALAAIDAFLERAGKLRTDRPAGQSDLLAPLEAKATVMAAAITTRAGVGTMNDRIERLRGFEERFSTERELLPEVRSLRVVAYSALGDLDDAGRELEALLAFQGADSYRHESLKKLGVVFLKEASRREEAGDSDGAKRSRRVALRVYERLLDDARSGRVADAEVSVAGLESLVADLRRQVGAS